MNEMNTIKDIQALQKMRDELIVQAHLFSMDMKDEWEKLEKQFNHIKSEMKPVKDSMVQAKKNLADSYHKFREVLKKERNAGKDLQ